MKKKDFILQLNTKKEQLKTLLEDDKIQEFYFIARVGRNHKLNENDKIHQMFAVNFKGTLGGFANDFTNELLRLEGVIK